MAKLIYSCELFIATVRVFSKIVSMLTFASSLMLVAQDWRCVERVTLPGK